MIVVLPVQKAREKTQRWWLVGRPSPAKGSRADILLVSLVGTIEVLEDGKKKTFEFVQRKERKEQYRNYEQESKTKIVHDSQNFVPVPRLACKI